MQRVDVFASYREEAAEETREFTDPLQKGQIFSLTLCSGGNDFAHLAVDVRNDLIRKYISGSAGVPPVEFPPVGKRRVRVSESLFETVANVYVLQPGERDEERYSPEELVAFAVAWRNAWPQVIAWAESITNSEQEPEKNDSGAALSST